MVNMSTVLQAFAKLGIRNVASVKNHPNLAFVSWLWCWIGMKKHIYNVTLKWTFVLLNIEHH